MSLLTLKDKTQLYYNDLGKGEPVVLIHGWPLNSDMWEYQALTLLERGFRVISYDRRGFGRSSQPEGGYDYDTLASDLNELMEQLDLKKARLVGFSMGGGEVARYLTKFGPSRVEKAILISSVVPYLLQDDSNPKGVPNSVFQGMIDGLKEDRPKFLASFSKAFFGVGLVSHPVSAEILHWTSFLAFQASPKATIDCVNAFGKTDFRKDLKSFTMPTLVIHGDADKTVPMEVAGAAAAKGIAGAKFKEYKGAPHGLFLTHRSQLNEDLLSFL